MCQGSKNPACVQTITSTAKVSGRQTQAQAKASGPRAATSKPAAAKKASSTVKPGTRQPAACTSAKKRSSSSPEAQETLPIKARPAAGTTAQILISQDHHCKSRSLTLHYFRAGSAAAEAVHLAIVASTVEGAEQPTTELMPPQDNDKPRTSAAAPELPAVFQQKVAATKEQKLLHSNTLPKHMTKGIQINSPGPAYRAPGLKRPQGGKPLHQIQPRTQ